MKVLLLGLPLLLAHTNVTIAKSTLNDIARGRNVSESPGLSPNKESTAGILKQDTTSRTSNQAENAEERGDLSNFVNKVTSTLEHMGHNLMVERYGAQLISEKITPEELFRKLGIVEEDLFKSRSFKAWFHAVQKTYPDTAGDYIIEVLLKQIVKDKEKVTEEIVKDEEKVIEEIVKDEEKVIEEIGKDQEKVIEEIGKDQEKVIKLAAKLYYAKVATPSNEMAKQTYKYLLSYWVKKTDPDTLFDNIGAGLLINHLEPIMFIWKDFARKAGKDRNYIFQKLRPAMNGHAKIYMKKPVGGNM